MELIAQATMRKEGFILLVHDIIKLYLIIGHFSLKMHIIEHFQEVTKSEITQLYGQEIARACSKNQCTAKGVGNKHHESRCG